MAEPSKPTHVPGCLQSQLEQLYAANNLDEKLAKCRQEIKFDRPRKSEDTAHSELTEHERAINFRDPDTNDIQAVIIWYTDIFGEVTRVIRSLRVGNIIYDARQRQT